MPRHVFDLQNVLMLGGLQYVNWIPQRYMDISDLSYRKELLTSSYNRNPLSGYLCFPTALFLPKTPWVFWSLRCLPNPNTHLSISSQHACLLLSLWYHTFCVKPWFGLSLRKILRFSELPSPRVEAVIKLSLLRVNMWQILIQVLYPFISC